jgi:molybdopterin-synthase adenylyltransferase
MATDERYSRHYGFFGKDGQERINSCRVGIVGLGGLGIHVAQQLAYLGVVNFVLVDKDFVALSNLNRLVGATVEDAEAEIRKLVVAERVIRTAQGDATIIPVARAFTLDDAPAELAKVDVVFGCVDEDPARLALTEFCAVNAVPYVDLATDILPGGEYGGRMVFAKDGERCLSCLDELDQHALARARMTDDQRAADDKIYGVDRQLLGQTGPSVVSLNGVVASLGVTEFAVWVTGLREPQGLLTYRADRGTVGARSDSRETYCDYCERRWRSSRSDS